MVWKKGGSSSTENVPPVAVICKTSIIMAMAFPALPKADVKEYMIIMEHMPMYSVVMVNSMGEET